MPLFQQAVIRKYIADVPKQTADAAWLIFQQHFHNTAIQQNIRNAKEEQYQEGFLRELFVAVFGYTLNPQPDFNLTTEYKNEKDSKKADGAILHAGQVTAIIELKGTETTDLGKVESQAFNYKNNQKSCTYVITSNFEKLRFYINDAVEWEEFDLFTLSFERFALLYACLHKDNLLSDVPLQMKQASVAAEENITRKLYADYSQFKKKLFHNITSMNPQHDKLLLFKKTQKLLDRFLFIFFAEDRLLLPPNSVREILKQWEQLKELDNYVPLYQRFKKYFGYLNTGHKGKLYEIFAYNGGLFAPDELLDSILIDDEILYASCVTLSNYNFESEVDVNILGHIFEHSLNEIEELEKSLLTRVVSAEDETAKATISAPGKTTKTTSRRKKDGVFYTPRYITKYIVENTVGALCAEQKKMLGIAEDEFTVVKRKANRKQLLDKIESYREWLLQLTICDPACGSGAFLNQALEFLIAEHRYIDEMKAKLFGDAIVLSDVENVILENNLFGVDINDEAVEIARLSLWLRTAKKGRKLNRLTNNIQCGNSLIDDPAVAADKAFNWKEAFPAIFAKGGFDVVIGNPPYVFTRGNSFFNTIKTYIWNKYPNNQGKLNLYSIFLELSLNFLVKENGYLSFITPETFIRTSTYEQIRKFVYENYNIEFIDIYGIGVFENVTAETVTMIIRKSFSEEHEINFSKNDASQKTKYLVKQSTFKDNPQHRFVYDNTVNDDSLFERLKKGCIELKQIVDVKNGIATKAGKNEFISSNKIDNTYKKLLEAPEIFRYGFAWSGNFIRYDREALHRPRKEETFLSEKILIQRVSSKLVCAYDNEKYYTFNSINNLVLINNSYSLKYILCLLNSKLINYYYKKRFSLDANFTITVTKENLDVLPIKELSIELQEFLNETADIIINNTKSFQQIKQQLLGILNTNFLTLQLNKKLENWPSLTFGELIKELEKQKIKLTLSQQAEWMQYFKEQKTKAQQIQQIITATDKEIDKMVYELYELTEEEIAIVEVQG